MVMELKSLNKPASTTTGNAFDLGTAYDNNQKMKYRQQGIDAIKQPEPFKMDLGSIQSDPTYQAAMESARQATQTAEGNISAAMNRRGIMDSNITANAASNAAQNEYGRVNRELLPKLIEDQYKRYMDQANMNRQYASDLFGVSDMYRNDEQDALNRAVTESGITGSYVKPEAVPIMERLVRLKNSTEAMWSQLTPEQQQRARAEADAMRAQLQSMNVNPDLFGANVTAQTAQGNIGQAGIPTLAAQNQNFNQGLANKQANWGAYMDVVGQTQNLGQGPQSNWGNLINQAGTGQNTFAANQNQFNQGVTMAQLTGFLPDGTPTSAQQQQDLSNLWTVAQQTGIIPNQLADLYNLPRGSRTQDAIAQAAQIAISQQNANTSAFSASTGRMNANNSQLMDIWKATGQAPDGITGVAKGTPYASTSSSNDQKYDYKSDPSFAQGISWVNANPSTALEAIRKDSATFIDRFGYSGYQEMLKAAEAVAP